MGQAGQTGQSSTLNLCLLAALQQMQAWAAPEAQAPDVQPQLRPASFVYSRLSGIAGDPVSRFLTDCLPSLIGLCDALGGPLCEPPPP